MLRLHHRTTGRGFNPKKDVTDLQDAVGTISLDVLTKVMTVTLNLILAGERAPI